MRQAAVGSCAVLLACVVQATEPSAGAARDAQLRALEDQRRAQLPRSLAPAPVAPLQLSTATGPRRPWVPNEQPCRVVHTLQLAGPHAPRFAWATQEFDAFADRCLGPQSLQALMLNLNDALLAQGYVTSRFGLAPQDLAAGVLTVTVSAGLIDRIEWTDGTQTIGGDPHALPAAVGDVLNVRDLDQALDHLARLPSLSTHIQIEPGRQPHTSTVRIDARRTGRCWRGQWGVDNSGAREFGRTRFNAWLGVDAPLGWADQLFLAADTNLEQVGANHRSAGMNGAWSVPFGYHLLTLSQSASQTGRSVAGTTLQFHLASTDWQRDIRWQTTLLRLPQLRLDGFVSAGQRRGHTQLGDIELIVQRRDSRRREAGVSLQLQGPGADLTVTLSEARTVRVPLPDAFRDPSEPAVALTQRLGVDLTAVLPWLGQPSYVARFDTQRTRHPLAVTPPMVLGSRDTVRGYSGEHTLAASSGLILRQELRWPTVGLLQPFVAADYGALSGPDAALLPRRQLAGVAVGARLQQARWSAEVMLARPVRAPENFPGTDVWPSLSFSMPL